MATIYKVLGQSAPSSTSTVDLYTVPSSTNTVTSTLMICNRSTVTASYNVAIRPAGASIANQHYIAFNSAVSSNDSIVLTLGMSLGATDVITVQANTTGVNNLGFTVFGSEIT
jgi:hypothetical protein